MQRIILDVDSSGDAILAVLFAAASPQIALAGVTNCSSGTAGPIELMTRMVLDTLHLAGRDDIPVAAGAWRPIVGHAPADMAAGAHFQQRVAARLGDRMPRCKAPAPPYPLHAVDFLLQTVRESPGTVTLVTAGPLTNVAIAMLQEPDFAGALKQLIVLGGAFGAPGNMTPVSEYNIWADPEASRIVLDAGIDTILVPLDVCADNRAATGMLTRDDLAEFAAAAPDGPVVRMIVEVFPALIDNWREFFDLVGLPMGAAIATALAVAPDLCTMTEPVAVDVVLDGRLARGQTIARRGRQILAGGGPATVRICTGIDGRRFMRLFRQAILGAARAT